MNTRWIISTTTSQEGKIYIYLIKKPRLGLFKLVRRRGLEPPHLAVPAPQTGAATITPPARHLKLYQESTD